MPQLVPSLSVYGRAQHAIDFYSAVFGATLTGVWRFKDSPLEYPPDWADRYLHAELKFGGNTLYIDDGMPHHTPTIGDGIRLFLNESDSEKAENLFRQLSVNGKVELAFGPAFWGALYGVVIDQFGVMWDIHCFNQDSSAE